MVWDRRTVSRVLRDDHYTRMPRITVGAWCSMTLSAEHNRNYSAIFGESYFSPKMAE